MGAVFEISMISKSFIPLEVCTDYFSCLGFSFLPERLECIQDWDWSGHKTLPFPSPTQDISSLVTTGHIVLLYGALGPSHAGIFIYQNMDGTFQTDLWFQDALYPHLPDLVALNAGSFQSLEDHLQRSLHQFDAYAPILAVMGEEIMFEYLPDLDTCRRRSCVDRWISFKNEAAV